MSTNYCTFAGMAYHPTETCWVLRQHNPHPFHHTYLAGNPSTMPVSRTNHPTIAIFPSDPIKHPLMPINYKSSVTGKSDLFSTGQPTRRSYPWCHGTVQDPCPFEVAQATIALAASRVARDLSHRALLNYRRGDSAIRLGRLNYHWAEFAHKRGRRTLTCAAQKVIDKRYSTTKMSYNY